MPSLERQLLAFSLRSDLIAFIRQVFQTVSPGQAYLHNWHIEAIAHHLMESRAGRINRLAITQPPRSLKSICTSIAYVAWALGHDPSVRFICVSYSADLAGELSRQFRLVVSSDWYKKLFPRTRIAKETGVEVITEAGGGRFATSIGGTLTGRGADVIIIDDPLKAEEAQSESARKGAIDWYRDTLSTRLNDKRKGVIILVMQRLHEEDLAGYLLEQGGWTHLDLPAIATEDQRIAIGPDRVHVRREEDVLHPEREPREALERQKAQMGSQAFSAQYQQRPVPLEGNLIRREWFKTYEELPERGPGVQMVQSWDVATSTLDRRDYTVCTTWLVRNKDYHLVHVLRVRLEFPDVRKRVIAMAREFGAQSVLIEDAGPGMSLLQDLRRETPAGMPRPIGIKPEGDKKMRMEGQSDKFETGHVWLPKDAPWLAAFLHELLGFPNAKHDDQVDSVSQFLGWVARRRAQSFGPSGWILTAEPAPSPFGRQGAH